MYNIRKSLFILMLIGSFLLGVVLTGSVILIKTDNNVAQNNQLSDMDKFGVLKSYVDKYYLNEYDENEMMESAYKGYIDGLGDPYSSYMDAEEYDSFITSAMGKYSGVGITFSANDKGEYVVLEINPGSPAEKAGIKAGDILLTVDGKTYDNIDIMANQIRGEKGSKVTIEYSRGKEVKKVTMTRDTIVQASIEYKMLDNDTGYIKIGSFIESTSEDFDEALKAVEGEGAKDLILDLRDNGGGLVDECVKVADEFLDKGVVCYVEDKKGNTETYDAEDGKTNLKTIVLVNGNSASASEILAGALKDNGFEIVGEKTFGKGVIQQTVELEDGSALKITIMQYLSPEKHVIHEKGIKPDVKVKDNEDTEKDEQLEKAEELL